LGNYFTSDILVGGATMEFWISTLSSAIGAFVGVLGAFLIARWQIDRGQKLSNNPFYLRFNEAQIYINRFNEKVDRIIRLTQGAERNNARILLSKLDFLELKETIELTIKTINKDLEEVDFNKFVEDLGTYNQNAPLVYYKDLNFLLLGMVCVYNLLLEDCKYLLMNLPDKIDMPMLKGLKLNFILKKFRKKYNKMLKKLKI
jgi:hypothetical protein